MQQSAMEVEVQCAFKYQWNSVKPFVICIASPEGACIPKRVLVRVHEMTRKNSDL